jgi:hypothetical protein
MATLLQATADGLLVRFTANDFQPPEEEDTGDDVQQYQ